MHGSGREAREEDPVALDGPASSVRHDEGAEIIDGRVGERGFESGEPLSGQIPHQLRGRLRSFLDAFRTRSPHPLHHLTSMDYPEVLTNVE